MKQNIYLLMAPLVLLRVSWKCRNNLAANIYYHSILLLLLANVVAAGLYFTSVIFYQCLSLANKLSTSSHTFLKNCHWSGRLWINCILNYFKLPRFSKVIIILDLPKFIKFCSISDLSKFRKLTIILDLLRVSKMTSLRKCLQLWIESTHPW